MAWLISWRRIGGWVGLRAGVDAMEKNEIFLLPGIKS